MTKAEEQHGPGSLENHLRGNWNRKNLDKLTREELYFLLLEGVCLAIGQKRVIMAGSTTNLFRTINEVERNLDAWLYQIEAYLLDLVKDR